MALPLSPEELKDYNNVPTTPMSQKLGDTINDLLAGSAYQVADMAARNALTPDPNQVVRVESTGELFVWDASTPTWRVVPNSSTKPAFFKKTPFGVNPYIYVSTTGSDVNGEGTQASPFASVTRALQSIPNGYVDNIFVLVEGGSYSDVEWIAPQPASRAAFNTEGGSSLTTTITIYGQGHINSEIVTLGAGNLPASTVPHPSGLGNYASIRQYNFPVWTTAIPGSFPTAWPVSQVGTVPQYQLISALFSGGFYASTNGYTILPGSDNTTGNMRLLNASNLFSTGDYFIADRDSFPAFPSLTRIKGFAGVFPFLSMNALSFTSSLTLSIKNVSMRNCYREGSLNFLEANNLFSNVFAKGSSSTTVTFRDVGPSISYFSNVTVKLEQNSFLDLALFDSTGGAITKAQIGQSVYTDTNNGAATPSAAQYAGYLDFIGGGIGMSLLSSSILQYNSFTFDGVSNPMVLSRSHYARRAGGAIGTSTAPTIVGIQSSTGPATILTPSGAGVSGWTITNTSVAGQEIQVGGNVASTYASLPSTDFSLGNTSLGAVGR
jgi:hypothetical protein